MNPGATVGNYEVGELIGRGAMGTVFRGVHRHLMTPVAIKVLHGILSQDQEARRRFLYEAKAGLAAEHRNVVKVIDYGVSDEGECYLVMELLVGESLQKRLERGRLDELTAIRIATAVADALSVAHVKGVIHRDLKPANLFVTDEAVKVLDFGLAKVATSSIGTPTGNVVGTLRYIAPELCRGAEHSGPASDIYSLGVVMYEMVAGRPPFVAKEAAELVSAHLFDAPPRLTSMVSVLPGLEELILDCLSKEPTKRPPSMAALRQRLTALVEEVEDPGGSYRRRRWRSAAVVAVIVTAVAVASTVAWWATRGGPQPEAIPSSSPKPDPTPNPTPAPKAPAPVEGTAGDPSKPVAPPKPKVTPAPARPRGPKDDSLD